MEERHWWFANKLQETFKFGGFDSPTLLEDFLADPDVCDLLNKFLGPGEPRKLFFYCDKTSHGSSAPRRLHLTPRLGHDVAKYYGLCFYVLRTDPNWEVDVNDMEKELICGEVRFSGLTTFTLLLSEAFLPLLQANKYWGQCTEEEVTQFLVGLNKFLGILSEMSTVEEARRPVLERAKVPQVRLGPLSGSIASGIVPEIVGDLEGLVAEWINTIDRFLADALEDRQADPSSVPMNEVKKWKHRLLLLTSIVEQVKSKECSGVITILVAAKSKLLKKWKIVDSNLTKAYNDARSKMHFLEHLQHFFEELSSCSDPSHAMKVILPQMTANLSQPTAIAYAKSGYLGLLMSKVTNSLVQVCVRAVASATMKKQKDGVGFERDWFWDTVEDAAEVEALNFDSRRTDTAQNPSALVTLLLSFQQLKRTYRQLLLKVKDNLQGAISLPGVVTALSGSRGLGGSSSAVHLSPLVSRRTKEKKLLDVTLDAGPPALSPISAGIPLANIDDIMQHLVDFCTRAGQLQDIIQSVGQFRALGASSVGLPHAPCEFWDLSPAVVSDNKDHPGDAQLEVKKKIAPKDSLIHKVLKVGDIEDSDPITEDEGIDTDTLSRTSTPEDQKQPNTVQIVSEVFVMDEGMLEEDGGQNRSVVEPSQQDEESSTVSVDNRDEVSSTVDQVCLESEPSSLVREGNLSALVQHRLSEIMLSLRRCDPGAVGSAGEFSTASLSFSMHGEHKEVFVATFADFSSHVAHLEMDVTAYIHHLFRQKMTSITALGYMDKLSPLHSRSTLRPVLYETTVGILRLYVNELEELQNHYEQHKNAPQGPRGSPKIVGAVSWCRQLYDKVNQPMKVFSRNKSIAHTNEHSYSVKLYNKFSLTLIRFEDQWLQQWKGSLAGKVKTINHTLLERVVPPGTEGSGIVQVNSSVECLLEVLEEAKGLSKLNVVIPDSVKNLLHQESRIKDYKQHLDEIVKIFYSTCKSVDSSLMLLLQPHAAKVMRSLQPGWSTLTWSSLNIDAYLHHAYSSLDHFQQVARCIADINRDEIQPRLNKLSQLNILDYDKLEGIAWSPKDFLHSVSKQATVSSQMISDVVSLAENGVVQILEESHKMETLMSPPFSPNKPSPRPSKPVTKHNTTGKRTKTTGTGTTGTRKNRDTMESVRATDDFPGSSQTVTGTPRSEILSRDQSSKAPSTRTLQSQPPLKSLSVLLHTTFANSPSAREVVEDFNRQLTSAIKSSILSCLDLLYRSLTMSCSKDRKVTNVHSDQEETCNAGICFTLGIQFFIPQVAIHPSLAELCSTMDKATNVIIGSMTGVRSWTQTRTGGKPLSVIGSAKDDPDILNLQRKIIITIRDLEHSIVDHLDSLTPFDPLWQRDLHATYRSFVEQNPTVDECRREVERHHAVEKKVSLVPDRFVMGCIHLTMEPMKHTLLSLARAWKTKFSSHLHQQAKKLLDEILHQHQDFTVKLQQDVETLEDLRDSIVLLHDIMDLENVIDNKFLEVEKLYSLLKEYEIRLPRQECQQVNKLRTGWKGITELAERVQHNLLAKRRLHFEHLVDKEVQGFNVDSNQFHNSFDSEGPLVPGLLPSEAVKRLGIFLGRYKEFQSKALLLNTVQRQLDMQVTPFSELVRTGEDLTYLSSLYDTYQKFIEFDEHFQEQLWAHVDLKRATTKVEGFWQSCHSLPLEQQHWEASKKLTQKISYYRELLPLLSRLHGKEICTRHWLQVMTVSGCTLQLEANVFRLKHLVAAKLLDHQTDIEAIIESAQHEQNLENQLNDIKEEWTEQMLQFESYKSHGSVLLSQSFTRGLLEQLEHAHTSLSIMLKSVYVTPHRDEAAQWSLKLTSIADVLHKWLSVQELWQSLEAVFSNENAMKEFASEVVRFSALNGSWLKLMRTTSETRNAINCCLGDDIIKNKVLDQLQHEMEECKKSLSSYLATKKKSFPHFNFISDSVLLGILSATNPVESVKPYLPSLFGNIAEVGITYLEDIDHGSWPVVSSVSSVEGEVLEFVETVLLGGDLELWLSEVMSMVRTTLEANMSMAICDIYEALQEKENRLEGFVHKHHCQVACVALHYYWTQETGKALTVCRYDRKAIPGTKTRFNMAVVNKLTAILGRGRWKNSDTILTHLDRSKLEMLALFAIALRDMSEDLVHRKLRDISDFEWQRFPRVNNVSELKITEHHFTGEEGKEVVGGMPNPGKATLAVECLDVSFPYAYEYLGCKSYPVFTPRTLNCIVAFTQSLLKYSGCELVGPVGCGKASLISELGMLYGRHVYFMHCNQLTSPSVIMSIMEGCSQCGSWSCFVGVTGLRAEVLSLLGHLLQVITSALRAKEKTYTIFTGQQVPVLEGFSAFVTRTDFKYAVSLPSYIREHFRSFTLTFPPPGLLFKVHAAILGYKQPRLLADRLVMMYTLIREQIPESALNLQSIVTVLKVVARKQQHLAKQSRLQQQQQQQQQQQHEQPYGDVSSYSLVSPMHTGGTCNESTPTHLISFRLEHVQVVRGIVDNIMPQFLAADLPVFTAILRDTFVGAVDSVQLDTIIQDTNHKLMSVMHLVDSEDQFIHPNLDQHASSTAMSLAKKAPGGEKDILPVLLEEMRKMDLILHQPWLTKVSQVIGVLSSMHAVVLCGGAGSGKSTCIDAIVSAENVVRSSSLSEEDSSVPIKLHKIYSEVFQDPPELYGVVDDDGDWRDGVFSALLRKTLLAQQSVGWFSFDSPLSSSWLDYLSSLLGMSRVFEHANGDHLSIGQKNIKFIFETGDLKDASPVVLTHCGLVYFEPSTLDWGVLVDSWLNTRKPHEVQCLRKYIDSIIDPVCAFVLKKLGRSYCMAGIINTTLSYLTSLLNMYAETAEAFSESHVERLFLFAVIWGCGGALKEQVEFSDILKNLTTSLPDDDSAESVFDYYVDESGEWDVWQTCVPRVDYWTQVDPINGLFIETEKTLCVKTLLDLAHRSRQHVLLIGSRGSGKTVVTNNFLSHRGVTHSKTESVKKLAFNQQTKSSFLHHFMKINFHRRQGQTYGPYQGKLMDWFIDDLHLPSMNSGGTVTEYIRQLVDVHGLYNLSRQHEWSHVEDFVIFGTGGDEQDDMSISDPRAKRHFAVIRFPTLQGSDVSFIINNLAEGYLLYKGEGAVLTKDAVTSVAEATVELYREVCDVLGESSLPGRQHYLFSFQHVTLLYQGLLQCLQSIPEAAVLLPLLWKHEAVRVFCDGVTRERDFLWFHDLVNNISQDVEMAEIDVEVEMDFIALTSLPLKYKSTQGSDPGLSIVKKVEITPIVQWGELRPALTQYLTRYREEHGPVDITLSDVTIQHLVRIHRSIMSSNSCGHVVMGAQGTPLDALVRFALYIAGYWILEMQLGDPSGLEYAKQALFRQAGLERKRISTIFTENALKDENFMQIAASFVACGDIPVSFTGEEEDGLKQAVAPAIKRDFPGRKVEPLQYFNCYVRSNLCLLFPLPSDHDLMNKWAKSFPSFIHSCTVVDLCEWRPDSVLCTARNLVERLVPEDDIPDDLKTSLTKCVTALHTVMLQETSHLVRAGFYPQVENLDSSSAVPPLDLPAPYQPLNTVEQSLAALSKLTTHPTILEEEEKDESTDRSSDPGDNVSEDLVPAMNWEPRNYVHGHIPSLNLAEPLVASLSLTEKVYILSKKESSHKSPLDSISLPYVGPRLLEQFMECLCSLYIHNSTNALHRKNQLTRSLKALGNIRLEVESLKKSLEELNRKYKNATKLSSTLMEGLSAKTCEKEVIHAKLGHESSVRKAMNVVADQDHTLNYHDDESLLEIVFGDSEQRSSRLDSVIEQCRDNLEDAVQEEREMAGKVQRHKREAKDLLSRIDRNTVDLVKSLNNPPSLVCVAMELVIRILQPTHAEALNLLQPVEGSMSAMTGGGVVDGTSLTSPARSIPRSKKSGHSGVSSSSREGRRNTEREEWPKIQLAIGDSQKFLDLLHGMLWEEGLTPDAVQMIDSRFANSRNCTPLDNQLSSKSKALPKHHVSGEDLLTIQAVKHASEAVGLMCSFILSTLEHHYLLEPYRRALEKVHKLERELKDLQDAELPSLSDILAAGRPSTPIEESQPSEADVEKLSKEISALHKQFDKAALEKHKLNNLCDSHSEKLKIANQLLTCLKEKQETWTEELENFPEQSQILGESVMAAAFIVYAAALKPVHRSKVMGWFNIVLNQYNLTVSSDFSVSRFLLGVPEAYKYVLDDLPPDPSTADSASVLLSVHKHCSRWPLVCDTYKLCLQLLRKRYAGRLSIVTAKSPHMQKKLIDCLSEGTPLVVSDVDPKDITENNILRHLINLKKLIREDHDSTGERKRKIKVGEREVECSPQFCVYLVTHSPVESVPAAAAAEVLLVNFAPEREGLEDHLFGQFLAVQNMKTFNDWRDLHERIYKDALRKEKFEFDLLEILSTSDHPDNPDTAKNLMQLNSLHQDATEDLMKCKTTLKELDTHKLSVTRALAHRASVILWVVCNMSHFKPVYKTCYDQVKTPLLTFINHIGRINNEKEAVNKLTVDSHRLFVQTYSEADQLIFSFTLAVEIEASEGRITDKEREFFIHPHVGTTYKVRGVTRETPSTAGSVELMQEWLNFGKKPFDWMKDDQWKRLLMLGTEFSWSHSLLQNMNREGKEYVWRQLGEERSSEISEGIKANKMPGQELTWMQRFLLARCFRPDRLPYLMNVFARVIFSNHSINAQKIRRGYLENSVDLSSVIKTITPKQAILLLFEEEPHIVIPRVSQLAERVKVPFTAVYTFGSHVDLTRVKRTLIDAIDLGHWLLLHCVHTSKKLLEELPHLLHEVRQQASSENGFRLWLSADSTASLPVNLLFSVTKLSLDSPVSIPYSVPHSLSCTAGRLVQGSTRQDWLPLLHNLSLLHAVLKGRAMVYPHSWSTKYNWGYQQLMDIMNFSLRDFTATEMAVQMGNTVRLVSWAGIRHMITEVLYGSHVTNVADQSTLDVLTEYWIHPVGTKRDIMEMPRGIYHIPGIFYQPGTRLPALIQAVESASLAFTAELCGLHHTTQANLWVNSDIPEQLNFFFGQLSQTERNPSFAPVFFNSQPPHQAIAEAIYNVKNLNIFDGMGLTTSGLLGRHKSFAAPESLITPRRQSRMSEPDSPTDVRPPALRRRQSLVPDGLPLPMLSPSPSVLSSRSRRITFAAQYGSRRDTLLDSSDHANFTFFLKRLIDRLYCKWKEELKTGSGLLGETVYDKLQKFEDDPCVYSFLRREVLGVMKRMKSIRSDLQELQHLFKKTMNGDKCPDKLAESALVLIKGTVPKSWVEQLGSTSPPQKIAANEWVSDLTQRYVFLDKLLNNGRKKTPVVNLGFFLHPQTYCSIIKQEALRKYVLKTGSADHLTFSVKVEPTNREKENIRDPPADGIFAHGLYMWGVDWEKNASLEIMDIEPKQSPPSALPVLHLTAVPYSEGPPKENTKGPFTYNCPCYISTTNPGPHLLDVCFTSTDIPPARWQIRGVICYLKNF